MQDTKFFSSNPMYGHAYVPIHTMGKIFTPEIGLENGTIFPELVSPYAPLQSFAVHEYLQNYKEGGCSYGMREQ